MAEKQKEIIKFSDKYTYNQANDDYIFNLKSKAKPLVLNGATVRALFKAFSSEISSAMSTNDVSRKYKIPAAYLEEVKKILGITRDSLPLSNEELFDNDAEKCADKILEEKTFQVAQVLEKKSWKSIVEKADLWDQFQHNVLDPFQIFVDNFSYKSDLKPIKPSGAKSDENLIIGVNDIHFGCHTNERDIFHGEAWNIEKTESAIQKYCMQIVDFVNNRKNKIKHLHLFFCGDLLHTLDGKTSKGTEIEAFPIGQEQLDRAFNSLVKFITYLTGNFNYITIDSVCGNHSYHDTTLMKMIRNYFNNNENIKFYIHETRWAAFNIKNSMFIIEHGASNSIKSKVPNDGAPLEAYVQKLFMSRPELLVKAKSRYFINGDTHTFSVNQYCSFDHIVFGHFVGSDYYADQSNLCGRPRQNGLILTDDGITEVINFYL